MAGLGLSLRRFAAEEAGATAIEYGLVVGLIGLAIVVAITTLSGSIDALYNYIIDTAGTAIGNA
jgi:pilus assembly protein Flp/PilA